MNSSKIPLLGILGGLGPMSGVYFCEMLTTHTDASRDAEHLNFLLSSRADTPDRSSFILGSSERDPAPVMAEEAQRLEGAGADVLAIPCNTAHYFYKRICEAVKIPIINIIEETAAFCRHSGYTRVGVLATEGTAASGAYSDIFTPLGIEIIRLEVWEQAVITEIIFDQIKKGEKCDLESFMKVCNSLCSRGCQQLILGCTELSLIKKQYALPPIFTDSLEILALSAIRRCNKKPIGFDAPLMNYYFETEKGENAKCFFKT